MPLASRQSSASCSLLSRYSRICALCVGGLIPLPYPHLPQRALSTGMRPGKAKGTEQAPEESLSEVLGSVLGQDDWKFEVSICQNTHFI